MDCKNCNLPDSNGEHECTRCGFPLLGTEAAQSKFLASIVMKEGEVKDAVNKLNAARVVLGILAFFHLTIGFIMVYKQVLGIAQVFYLVIGAFFVGCIFLSYKKPIIALGLPLGLIILNYIILGYISLPLLYSGWIWKGLILALLGAGFVYARRSKKILKQNSYLASKYSKVKLNDAIDSNL